MENRKNVIYGMLTGLLAVLYCILVALFMFNINKLFSDDNNGLLGIIAALILLVISAAITGSLVFAYPAYLFINKKFKSGLYAFLANIISIIILGIIIFIIILLTYKFF